MKILKILFFLLLTASTSFAETFQEFSERINSRSNLERKDGLGMMISGGIALVGGGFGWSSAKKPVEKGFSSLAQSLGLLAIGYGAESYFLKQDEEIFLQVLSASDITQAQKDRMVASYLREHEEREEKIIWIRRGTFGLGGLINIVNAGQTKDESLKSFLYVAAGLQLAWAFAF